MLAVNEALDGEPDGDAEARKGDDACQPPGHSLGVPLLIHDFTGSWVDLASVNRSDVGMEYYPSLLPLSSLEQFLNLLEFFMFL